MSSCRAKNSKTFNSPKNTTGRSHQIRTVGMEAAAALAKVFGEPACALRFPAHRISFSRIERRNEVMDLKHVARVLGGQVTGRKIYCNPNARPILNTIAERQSNLTSPRRAASLFIALTEETPPRSRIWCAWHWASRDGGLVRSANKAFIPIDFSLRTAQQSMAKLKTEGARKTTGSGFGAHKRSGTTPTTRGERSRNFTSRTSQT